MNQKNVTGLKNYGQTNWTREIDRAIAKLPIAEISKRYGISPRSVRTRREKLGMPVNGRTEPIRWTKKRDALIGTMPDTELAKKLGTTKFLVRKRRIEIGVSAFYWEGAPESEFYRRDIHRWTKADDRLLGTQPDPVIADRLDLDSTVVARRRQFLGIDSFLANRPIEWTTGMLNLLGDVPDGYIAAEYEIAAFGVKIKRIEEGIKPYNSAYMDPDPEFPHHVVSLIGKKPDKQIADRYNVDRFHIRLYRALHGIPRAEYKKPTLFRWKKSDVALLGTMSDRSLAVRLGITVGQVNLRRTKLGIPAKGIAGKIVWTQSRISQLGKEPDARLARKWNCSQSLLRKKRGVLEIPACLETRLKLDKTQVEMLGMEPDTVLARKFGISYASISRERSKRGIPPFKSVKKYRWTKRVLAKLGKIHDEDLASELGLSHQFVAAKRRELEIPVVRRVRKIDWSDKSIIRRLGKTSDGRLSKELGVTPAAISYQRKKRGIPFFLQ